MNYAEKLKSGASMCIAPTMTKEVLAAYAAAGIDCAELSFPVDEILNKLDPVHRAEELKQMAEEAGVELWSLHLPFSARLDISQTYRELRPVAMFIDRMLIEAAAKMGIKVIVLHPSSEPILPEERPARMAQAKESIKELNTLCNRLGMTLAVENLPRTCLCNTSGEMIELLRGTGASVVFDTNHALKESSPAFIRALTAAGVKIVSVHISDYDFEDERHWLPGEGKADWHGILHALEENGYTGPLMYETSVNKAKEHNTAASIAENQRWLRAQY